MIPVSEEISLSVHEKGRSVWKIPPSKVERRECVLTILINLELLSQLMALMLAFNV